MTDSNPGAFSRYNLPMYEVEFKVEVTEAERAALDGRFRAGGFVTGEPLSINDHYVVAVDSPFGGYDLERYRDAGSKIFYTAKSWEKVGDGLARREIEREVTRGEFEAALAGYPNPVTIKKTRQPFSGAWQGHEIHVDMDSVKFDHSPAVRHFIEAELITADAAEVANLKEVVRGFLREALGRDEIKEAWGMFTMALKKL